MSQPDPDPTAAELARVVAWLRARERKHRAVVEHYRNRGDHRQADEWRCAAIELRLAADDLERGDEP